MLLEPLDGFLVARAPVVGLEFAVRAVQPSDRFVEIDILIRMERDQVLDDEGGIERDEGCQRRPDKLIAAPEPL